MAYLTSSDTAVSLATRTEIGRSPTTTLQIIDPCVSGLHARIVWTGEEWRLRDLGSTNGTFLNGTRLTPGQDRSLAKGDELTFGGAVPLWTVRDVEPPEVRAVRVDGGEVRLAEDGCIGLPDDASPVGIVREGAGTWVFETGETELPLRDRQIVAVAGVRWRVELPTAAVATRGRAHVPSEAVSLLLKVSPDREHVDVTVRHVERYENHPHRAHHELLLVLAEARLEDLRRGVAVSEAGWRESDWLCRALAVSKGTLNLHVHRVRKRFAMLDGMGEGGAIERRVTSGQLRLAPVDVQVVVAQTRP